MPQRSQLNATYQTLVVADYVPATAKDGQVLVEMKATSLNPLDWKRIAKNLFIPSYLHVLGMDIVGVVSDKSNSTKYKEGDRIMGIGTVGNSAAGSFQTHALIQERDTCLIPEEMSFVEAATVPFALSTAACALYLGLDLPRPWSTNKQGSPAVLIWGAGGSVGSFAVQLAKASGSQVIAVCSERSFDQMKRYGADTVLTPSHPETISQIRNQYPNLHLAFDLIVSESSISSCVSCLEKETGTVATAIMYKDSLGREKVSFRPTFSGAIQGARMGPESDKAGLELGKQMWQHLPALIQDKNIQGLQYEIIGGLEMVGQGLDRLQNGNYKTKLVVEI